MIIPIRCFTCGKLIADKWLEYEQRVQKLKEDHTDDLEDVHMKDIFIDLGFKRYCCKRMLLSHVDMVHIISNNKSNEYNYDNIK